jgi:hypothetical protein
MPAKRPTPTDVTRAADPGMRVEVRLDDRARPGSIVASLARLLRALRDRRRRKPAAGGVEADGDSSA